jgi:hypothetical protein
MRTTTTVVKKQTAMENPAEYEVVKMVMMW